MGAEPTTVDVGCGSEYEGLVRAGPYTTHDPFGLWCNQPAAALWFQRVQEVLRIVQSSINEVYQKVYQQKFYEFTRDIGYDFTNYKKDIDELPEPSHAWIFGAGECSLAVQRYIDSIRRGACLISRARRIVSDSGGVPVDIPLPPDPPPDTSTNDMLGNLVTLAGIGLAAYVLFKVAK